MNKAENLGRKRISVVKDEYFIASDQSRYLTSNGAVVPGPGGNLAAALTPASEPLDGAVLDVNLQETLFCPLADRLRNQLVPYLFVTGYDARYLPEPYRQAPRISKSFASQSIIEMMEKLIFSKGRRHDVCSSG